MAGNPAGILLASRFTGLAGGLTFACLASGLRALRVTGLASLAGGLALTCLARSLARARLARLTGVLVAASLTGVARILARTGNAGCASLATTGDTGLAGVGRTGAIGLNGFALFFFPFDSRRINSFVCRASGHAPAGCSQADVEVEFIIDFRRL